MSITYSELDMGEDEEARPLKITCSTTDCENNLHCFRKTNKLADINHGTACYSCGITLVDWERVTKRNISDVEHTFASLKLEFIRHHFWHKEIDEKAVNHARRKGIKGMRLAATKRIQSSVGKPSSENSFEGRQTPYEGNAICYAQHAVAACCRKCIEEWHGIPLEQALTEPEVEYFTELVMLFITERLPYLTTDGERVPSIRKKILEKLG